MDRGLALVLDADALYMLSLPEYRGLLDDLREYDRCVMTPNVVEARRLDGGGGRGRAKNGEAAVVGDVRGRGNCVVVRKGNVDTICQGDFAMRCSEEGGMKRSGGIPASSRRSWRGTRYWRRRTLTTTGIAGATTGASTMLLGTKETRPGNALTLKNNALQSSSTQTNSNTHTLYPLWQ